MAISLVSQPNVLPIRPLALKRRLNKVLRALGQDKASLTVLLTHDQEIQDLNRKFRGKDAPTNVLAFPGGEPFPGSKGTYLGDVAISLETVAREAEAANRPVGEVFYFYLIHGTLHLLGFDHARGPAEEAAQEKEEARLLALIPHDL
ncbi:MAG: rRNA maturation RNase YbeY [Deltaproteobacteria bacterium]|jgi:rRNA maturation RNase YbeY|nr:rRNA maturation RNase YbeY [Deltaproteobacteria bacterium]